MRFICVYRAGAPETTTAPTPEQQAAMGALIGDMAKAGVLLGAEGLLPSALGARVQIEGGEYRVTDGPFAENDLMGGFCLLQVKSKAEAIEWAKRFLALVKHGTSELRQLHDQPAG